MGLLSQEAPRWTATRFRAWVEAECAECIAQIREGKKRVAEALDAPKKIETLFVSNRKEMYNTLFKSRRDTVNSIESGGEILTGTDAVTAIARSVEDVFKHEKAQPEDEKIEWVKQMYKDHRDRQPHHFEAVMSQPTTQEIEAAIERTPNGKTGHLGVSNDLFKFLVRNEESRRATLATLQLLIASIMLEAKLPNSIKHIQMRMIPKPGNKTKDVNSFRPIAIIPELAKIISKILAKRVMDVLVCHPDILSATQRGFLRHGNIGQCIDVLIDALEDEKKNKKTSLHVASYDQTKAYDSVQAYTIRMSLERVNFPKSFINYVLSSLTDSTATILTDMGESQPIALKTGVKQGDPLAPLLFLFVVDPLHRGIEQNPLYGGRQDGHVIVDGVTVSDTAYADDFTVIARDWHGLQRIHKWVLEFMRFHNMHINATKSHFTCKEGEMKAGTELKKLLGSKLGDLIHVQSPDTDFRHLGTQINFELSWRAQRKQMQSTINQFRAQCRRNKLNALTCATAVREYLIPKLELGLKHADLPEKVLDKWNAEIRFCVLHTTTIRAPTKISKAGFHIIANIPNLVQLRKTIRAAELHIRLNSEEPPASKSIWARLTKMTRSDNPDNIVQYLNSSKAAGKQDSVGRAIKAMQQLNIFAQQNPSMDATEQVHIVEESADLSWSAWVAKQSDPYSKPNAVFKSTHPIGAIVAFTDGSTPIHAEGCSGVGVVLKREGHKDIEIAEAFKTSGNNYAAELMAILTTLKITPINSELTIFTDSKSAVQGLQKEFALLSERKQLRTPARPIVRSIHKILQQRKNVSTRLEWIRAHTGESNPYATANKRADELANEGRKKGEGMRLPEFTHNENKIIFRTGNEKKQDSKQVHQRLESSTHIPGDVRQELKRICTLETMDEWKSMKIHGELARINPTDIQELCKVMRQHKNNKLFDFYLQALTQTADTMDRRETVQCKVASNEDCLFCDSHPESLRHMFTCKEVRKQYFSKIQEVVQIIDPNNSLQGQLCWFSDTDMNSSLSKEWRKKFSSYKEDDEKQGVMETIERVEKHDKFAGLLGIMPIGLHDIMTKLILRTDKQEPNHEAMLQKARQSAATIIDKARRRLMQLSMNIWRAWKVKQKKFLENNSRCKKADPPVVKTPIRTTSGKTNPPKKIAEPTPKKRRTGRDKCPRIHGIKKKVTPKFYHGPYSQQTPSHSRRARS